MNAPGGGKNDIPNRLKRQFAIFNVPPPSTAAINDIFGSLMEGRFDAASFSTAVSVQEHHIAMHVEFSSADVSHAKHTVSLPAYLTKQRASAQRVQVCRRWWRLPRSWCQ